MSEHRLLTELLASVTELRREIRALRADVGLLRVSAQDGSGRLASIESRLNHLRCQSESDEYAIVCGSDSRP